MAGANIYSVMHPSQCAIKVPHVGVDIDGLL